MSGQGSFHTRASADAMGLLRARAKALKARLTVADLAPLLDYELAPSGQGHACQCPACASPDSVRITSTGQSWACSDCQAGGDLIDFYRSARAVGMTAALAALETLTQTSRGDDRTGDLFKKGQGHA